MANVKSAGVRELIIDRCLQNPRGHTIEELMVIVNRALQADGLPVVTSTNTIRNDIENIANRWKQAIKRWKRRQAIVYAYDDPCFSIYDGQLTKGELKQLYQVLQTLMYLDAYHGSIIYRCMCDQLKVILQTDHFQQPILFYDRVPSEQEINHFYTLFDCIQNQVPVKIEHVRVEDNNTALATVHPYFMRQHLQQWHLLGNDHDECRVKCLSLANIVSIERDFETAFIPGQKTDMQEYYAVIHEQMRRKMM